LTATWRLAQSLVPDKILLVLGDEIEDEAGNALDGEWTGEADSFPSGNGAAGGDFSFRINVLPGDVDGTTSVDVLDTLFARLRVGQQEGQPDYGLQFDVDGDGQIDVFDVLFVRLRVGQTTPPGEPLQAGQSAPAAPITAAAIDAWFVADPMPFPSSTSDASRWRKWKQTADARRFTPLDSLLGISDPVAFALIGVHRRASAVGSQRR
jgi:hypothetical protein